VPNEVLVFLIKALHTAVFVFASACILYVLRCGIVGRASPRMLVASIAVPSIAGILWWLNHHECILTSAIYKLSGGDRSQPDIFLPDWISRRIMLGSTLVLGPALCLVLWRQLMHKWRPGVD
jgi:hypothetical protein